VRLRAFLLEAKQCRATTSNWPMVTGCPIRQDSNAPVITTRYKGPHHRAHHGRGTGRNSGRNLIVRTRQALRFTKCR
jgi:hypothetical protein